jgi:hypothetical protein
LKDVRDKQFAHSEQIQGIEGPTWAAIRDLTQVAEYVVGVLGWAYFQTAYMINGEYVLARDARRYSKAMNHLVDCIGSPERPG